MDNKAKELLKKLFYSACAIDIELCTVLNNNKGTMTGDEYEKHMDVYEEVANYLGEDF